MILVVPCYRLMNCTADSDASAVQMRLCPDHDLLVHASVDYRADEHFMFFCVECPWWRVLLWSTEVEVAHLRVGWF